MKNVLKLKFNSEQAEHGNSCITAQSQVLKVHLREHQVFTVLKI